MRMDSSNHPYVNDDVRYIVRWLKFKLAGYNEYSEILGAVWHTVTSKGLGWLDHVSWDHYWNCSLSAVNNSHNKNQSIGWISHAQTGGKLLVCSLKWFS